MEPLALLAWSVPAFSYVEGGVRVSKEDQSYYRARAEQELTIANTATEPASAEVHRALAALYLARADEADITDAEVLPSAGRVVGEDNFHQIPQSGRA